MEKAKTGSFLEVNSRTPSSRDVRGLGDDEGRHSHGQDSLNGAVSLDSEC